MLVASALQGRSSRTLGRWRSSSDCFLIVADFNQDGKPDNISFMVKRIKVHSMDALKDSSYRFPLNYGVEKFLELFSGM
jgi:hypothetical protein